MKIEEMELAIARIDLMIGFLKKQIQEGTNNPQAAADIARYQQWRDDLEVQISLERIKRIKRGTDSPPRWPPLLHS
jgi:hypothetical protein